jgi:hypothetical protein
MYFDDDHTLLERDGSLTITISGSELHPIRFASWEQGLGCERYDPEQDHWFDCSHEMEIVLLNPKINIGTNQGRWLSMIPLTVRELSTHIQFRQYALLRWMAIDPLLRSALYEPLCIDLFEVG